MIERVISGGQTGADIGGLRAARAAGLVTGGWAARGWLIEGPQGRGDVASPELADFGLRECPHGKTAAQSYAIRRGWNVRDSDATLLFFAGWTTGTRGLLKDLELAGKPLALILPREPRTGTFGIGCPWAAYLDEFGHMIGAGAPHGAADWIREKDVRTLNVAGPRASKAPKIEAFAEAFLLEVFRHLAKTKRADAQV